MQNPGIYALCDRQITAAITGEAQTPIIEMQGVQELSVQFRFAYGSGGTSAKAWLQTSLDQGETWTDLVCFAATTASKTRTVNLKGGADAALFTPTSGAMADDTVLTGTGTNGVPLGDRFRVLVTTTGTYGGSTVLSVRAHAR